MVWPGAAPLTLPPTRAAASPQGAKPSLTMLQALQALQDQLEQQGKQAQQEQQARQQAAAQRPGGLTPSQSAAALQQLLTLQQQVQQARSAQHYLQQQALQQRGASGGGLQHASAATLAALAAHLQAAQQAAQQAQAQARQEGKVRAAPEGTGRAAGGWPHNLSPTTASALCGCAQCGCAGVRWLRLRSSAACAAFPTLPPLPPQQAPAALAQQAALAPAQLAQLAQFLPRTNEPSPDEQDDADESEVRDTFMVSCHASVCLISLSRTARRRLCWPPWLPLCACRRCSISRLTCNRRLPACAGVQACQAGLRRAAPGCRGGDRQPGSSGAPRHIVQAQGDGRLLAWHLRPPAPSLHLPEDVARTGWGWVLSTGCALAWMGCCAEGCGSQVAVCHSSACLVFVLVNSAALSLHLRPHDCGVSAMRPAAGARPAGQVPVGAAAGECGVCLPAARADAARWQPRRLLHRWARQGLFMADMCDQRGGARRDAGLQGGGRGGTVTKASVALTGAQVTSSPRQPACVTPACAPGIFPPPGDGAGVGKGRTIAGLILENWRQGRRKHLWLSVGSDLKVDTKRDLDDVGGEEGSHGDSESGIRPMVGWSEAACFPPHAAVRSPALERGRARSFVSSARQAGSSLPI